MRNQIKAEFPLGSPLNDIRDKRLFDPVTATLIATSAMGAFGSIQSGRAQEKAYEEQARQAESDAKSQLIERKRVLQETLAAQNVGAAAQGRTISSISALQDEDVRRAGYDETMIQGGAASQARAARTAGKQAKTQSYYQAGSSLLSGATQYIKLQ